MAATNILTADEAANALRSETTDQVMLELLPMVDAYIETATGRDWTQDDTIYEQAKAAARMLLVMWYENPAMISVAPSLQFGLTAALLQLEAIALELEESA